ncbi:MAG: DNA mismatch endonuclease Vsr [Alphaproteobacteria bacterium]
MDTLTPKQRSERMSRVRSKDTKPELAVRRLIHGMGLRYRLHRRNLPGSPDLVFSSRRKVILVHGCFWYRHLGCKLARIPKSRTEFWIAKLEGNRTRDIKNQSLLVGLGWEYLVVWECQVRDNKKLKQLIRGFLLGERKILFDAEDD